jgi:hypothetical protein
METLGIKSWRLNAEDGKELAVIIKEAKANLKALKSEEEEKNLTLRIVEGMKPQFRPQ